MPLRDRAAIGEMLSMTGAINVIIPHGGKSLTERILCESRAPTIQHPGRHLPPQLIFLPRTVVIYKSR